MSNIWGMIGFLTQSSAKNSTVPTIGESLNKSRIFFRMELDLLFLSICWVSPKMTYLEFSPIRVIIDLKASK